MQCYTDPELQTWLHRTAEGDVAAFEALYCRTAPAMLARVRRIAGDFFAEDVLSEVFLQVWNTADQYDSVRGTPMAWIATIARSRALDRVRHEQACHAASELRDDHGEPSHDETPEAAASFAQSRAQLDEALRALSADERMVVGLAYFRDRTQSEIAHLTGMPLGTVKTLMFRAQRKMRAEIVPAVLAGPSASGTP